MTDIPAKEVFLRGPGWYNSGSRGYVPRHYWWVDVYVHFSYVGEKWVRVDRVAYRVWTWGRGVIYPISGHLLNPAVAPSGSNNRRWQWALGSRLTQAASAPCCQWNLAGEGGKSFDHWWYGRGCRGPGGEGGVVEASIVTSWGGFDDTGAAVNITDPTFATAPCKP